MILPCKATDPAREASVKPLTQAQLDLLKKLQARDLWVLNLEAEKYHENPSPWARLGRWLFDRLTRR